MSEAKTEREKMLAGEMYMANAPELVQARQRAKTLCERYNRSAGAPDVTLLAELLGAPTDAYLEPPFYCDYGDNTRLGQDVYANHNLVVLDCALVTIGDHVYIGPNVVVSTAAHPVDPELRTSGQEFALPITIGHRVWLGASITILPGVTIGDDTTIGAGSIVTRSIPTGCVAVGNPCRVTRRL